MLDLCSFNVRGLNNKVAYVKDFLLSNRLSLIALLETRVKNSNAASISSFIAPNFSWEYNYSHHANGRIWLGWNPLIWTITVLSSSAQQLSCLIKHNASGVLFLASFVYAFNTYQERRSLWNELFDFSINHVSSSSTVNLPWTLAGDFNVCLDTDETHGGSLNWTTGMSDSSSVLSTWALLISDIQVNSSLGGILAVLIPLSRSWTEC